MKANDVLLQEKALSFQSLTNEDLLKISLSIVNRVKQEQLKNVRIRAVLNGDIVFQYLMDGKKGDIWLNRKQKTVEHFGHSGYYVFLAHQETGQYDEESTNDKFVFCGGGFPLIVQNHIVGSFCVSGLSHEQDHQLIVDALELFKQENK